MGLYFQITILKSPKSIEHDLKGFLPVRHIILRRLARLFLSNHNVNKDWVAFVLCDERAKINVEFFCKNLLIKEAPLPRQRPPDIDEKVYLKRRRRYS